MGLTTSWLNRSAASPGDYIPRLYIVCSWKPGLADNIWPAALLIYSFGFWLALCRGYLFYFFGDGVLKTHPIFPW
jgi:hypothetical protein